MTDPRDEALSAAVAAGLKRGGSLEDQYRAAIRAYLAHAGMVERAAQAAVIEIADGCPIPDDLRSLDLEAARASLAAITPEVEHD